METLKNDYSLIIPPERISLEGCQTAVEHDVHLEVALHELFGLHAAASDHLPFQLKFKPKSEHSPLPHWHVRLEGGITLANLDRHPPTLAQQKNAVNSLLETGSFRIGLQRWLLDWLGQETDLRVTYVSRAGAPGFVQGLGAWKVVLLWANEKIASWEAIEPNVKQVFLKPR